MDPVGSVEDDLELGAAGRRVRRNRRRVAGGVDRDLELLGGRLLSEIMRIHCTDPASGSDVVTFRTIA